MKIEKTYKMVNTGHQKKKKKKTYCGWVKYLKIQEHKRSCYILPRYVGLIIAVTYNK